VRVVLGNKTIGHLPCEFSRIAWYFLAYSGEISVEVIGRRRHYTVRMEISCQLEVTCSNKLQMKCLEELLAEKIQVYITSTESSDQQKVSMFHLYSLKVFSSIYDSYKPFYSH